MENKIKLITQDEINTERLNLTPTVNSDIEDIFAFMSNPNITRQMLLSEAHRSIEDTELLIDNINKLGLQNRLWSLRLKNTQQIIGLLQFFTFEIDQAEIHYALAEKSWNMGLMTEAVNSVISWTKTNFPQLKKISSQAMKANIGSRRVLEKCGFKLVNQRCLRTKKSYPYSVNLGYYELNLPNYQ